MVIVRASMVCCAMGSGVREGGAFRAALYMLYRRDRDKLVHARTSTKN